MRFLITLVFIFLKNCWYDFTGQYLRECVTLSGRLVGWGRGGGGGGVWGRGRSNCQNCFATLLGVNSFLLEQNPSSEWLGVQIRRHGHRSCLPSQKWQKLYQVNLVSLKCCCVEVLRPSQPNGVMSSAVSLPNHTFTGQA